MNCPFPPRRPGITRVPVGDQPDDIYAKVKALIMRYIQGDDKARLSACQPASLCVLAELWARETWAAGCVPRVTDGPRCLRALTLSSQLRRLAPQIILCIIPANGPDFSTAEGAAAALTPLAAHCRTPQVLTARLSAGRRGRLTRSMLRAPPRRCPARPHGGPDAAPHAGRRDED